MAANGPAKAAAEATEPVAEEFEHCVVAMASKRKRVLGLGEHEKRRVVKVAVLRSCAQQLCLRFLFCLVFVLCRRINKQPLSFFRSQEEKEVFAGNGLVTLGSQRGVEHDVEFGGVRLQGREGA